jgi:hypothetical protein
MPPRHLCPNCGGLREGPHALCADCYYPNHERQASPVDIKRQLTHPSFQFHIRTLLALTLFAAILCAVTRNWESDGLWLGIEVVGILFPVIEFLYYFWINLRSDKPDAIKAYEDRFR